MAVDDRSISVLNPREWRKDAEVSKKMFKKYSKFKQTVDPSASKVDYKKYLQKVVQEKNFFDSNINHTLTHQQKILASKNRELSQRAMALTGNKDMDNVHQAFAKVAKLRYEIDRKAHVRVSPDQFNYRSPQKYVSELIFLVSFIIKF